MRRGLQKLTTALTLLLFVTVPAFGHADVGSAGKETDIHKQQPKPGSKDDIDAVGTREMGGQGLGNWYSLEREIALGKQYSQLVESSAKLVKDPLVSEYVNRIGQNIVRNSDSKVPFTIKVIDASEINAFALPGGFLYLNTGILLAVDEEAELAGVIAHEVAHVAARHATRQMTRANFANIASIPLIFIGGGIGYAARSAAGIGLPMSFLKFSRGFEEEADYFGVQYMYKAGYDPQSFMTFFEKVQVREKQKPGTLSQVFASHPPIAGRIEKTQQQIDTRLPARSQYLVTQSEFDEVRTRVAFIEKRGRIVDQENEKKRPTLRRARAEDKRTTEQDDRPTLKRRDEPRE